jgi:hypothetical protein
MGTITIQGLSPKQRFFADILWKFSEGDDVKRFIESLPKDDQDEAHSVVEMMIWAVMDEYSQTDVAEGLLKKFTLAK